MIAGQSPRLEWRPNPGGQVRTIDEAMAIARKWYPNIPDDVEFFVDELGELHEGFTACGPRVDKPAGSTVSWSDLVHHLTGRVPFRIWSGILSGDEAIVAVIAHELFELEMLRPLLQEGATSIEDFIAHTRAGNPGNLHDKAWTLADELIVRMRKDVNS